MSSPVLGAGFTPFGVSFAGFGTPATTTSVHRQNQDLIIDEGPLKGQIGDVRLIDPVTQDYRVDANGRLVGGNGIQQMVYLALLTLRGSSVLSSLGQSYGSNKVIGNSLTARIKNDVQIALGNLIKKKQIALVAVNVATENNMARIQISWKDLTSGMTLTNTI